MRESGGDDGSRKGSVTAEINDTLEDEDRRPAFWARQQRDTASGRSTSDLAFEALVGPGQRRRLTHLR